MAEHPDIYDRLKQDHGKIRAMLKAISRTTERDGQRRRELFRQLRTELLAHEHAEEHAFYEPLEQHKESRLKALEGETEHDVVEKLLEELEKTPADGDHWTARFQVLHELTKHHIEEEERNTFEKARQVLSAPEAVSIAERFEKEKEQLKGQL